MDTLEETQVWVIVLGDFARRVELSSNLTQKVIDEYCKLTLADMAIQNEGGTWFEADYATLPSNPLEPELTPVGQPGFSSIQGVPAAARHAGGKLLQMAKDLDEQAYIPDENKYPRIHQALEDALERLAAVEQRLKRAQEVLESTRQMADYRLKQIGELEDENRMLRADR